MIRRFEHNDLDEVMSIWFHANTEAHSFIESDYWRSNYEFVKEMIPKAEVFVAEADGKIRGFIGLIDTYIAGIFVKNTEQSQGIGTELLQAVMETRDILSLNVYKKNARTVMFYQYCGFRIVNQVIDENTSEEEYTMEWIKNAGHNSNTDVPDEINRSIEDLVEKIDTNDDSKN